VMDSKGHYAAVLQNATPSPQPFCNFYARPVRDAAAVDAVHARVTAVKDEYGIAEITAPAREDAARFGVGTYGFYLQDLDGNWWRVDRRKTRMTTNTARTEAGRITDGATSATRVTSARSPVKPIVPSEHQTAAPAHRAAANPVN